MKVNKVLAWVIVMIMLSGLLAGCGPTDAPAPTAAPVEPTEAGVAPEPTEPEEEPTAVPEPTEEPEAVVEELSLGEFPAREDCLRLIEHIPLVPIEAAIAEIVQTYIARQVMPRSPVGDALHLALPSHHRCDFLVTWNCRHLANANKFDHIRRVNTMLGLFVPALVTPLELLGDYHAERG